MADRVRPRLHFEVHGDRGPYLLLVHGMLSSRAQWNPNLDALKRFSRPVIVELLGHGRSPTPDDPDAYTPARYCREFETIRRHLGAERWIVLGQSLGAALTLRYGLDHPDRVIAQAFTNSNSALAEPGWSTEMRPAMQALAERLETEGEIALPDLAIHPARSRLAEELKAPLVADAKLHTARGVGRTALHTVVGSSVRDRVHANRRPTLLVVGGREKRFSGHRTFAERTMPELEVVELPAGHAVNLEAAPGFDRAAADFFSRHLATQPQAQARPLSGP